MDGASAPVCLSVQRSKRENRPALLIHRAFDYLEDLEESIELAGKERVHFDKNMAAKQVLLRAAVWVTSCRLIITLWAKSRYDDDELVQLTAFSSN